MMNNKVNIFEELNKMKNLIYAKSGVVISEQDAMDTDIDTVRNQLVSNTGFLNNVDEQKIVDILKKYATDKNTFQNFLNQFEQKYKVKVNNIMGSSFSTSDQAEIDDLNSVLSKIGLRFTVSNGIANFEDLAQLRQKNIASNYCSVKGDKIENPKLTFNGRRWVDFVSVNKVTEAEIAAAKATCPTVIVPPAAGAAAGAAETPANAETPAATNLTDRQKNINFNYCSVKNGKIENTKSVANGKAFNEYVSAYKITAAEIAEAKKTCPNVVVAPPAPAGPTPTQRLATTAKSLGIQNPKMDVATLQTILNTLNQGGSGLTESKNSVNEELNKMKYILGYQRGRVISEQDAAQTQQAATQPAATPKDLIRQIQTVLKTKYNANLGKFGAKGDGIDEKWGNLTQTALENALKTIADVKQRRETETQQTTTQDTAIQQAAEKGRMEIPQTNNLPNLPGIQQKQDIYTTLVNNKTLVTRPNGNIVYKGVDLTSTQRQELETKLKTMGYNLSTDNRDKTYGDKLIFKKNQ
jgi:hypothetical protein